MGEKTLASRAAEISQCLKEETNAGRKDAFRYECMKTWAKGTDWSVQAHRRFSFMDMVPMCRVACARMLGVSAGKITTWCGWLSQGHVLPPQDMRSAKQCRDDHASVTSAHALWTWVYEYIAEPLAESRMTVRDFDVGMKVQKVLSTPSPSANSTVVVGVRYLAHGMSLTELWKVASDFVPLAKPSYMTWVRCTTQSSKTSSSGEDRLNTVNAMIARGSKPSDAARPRRRMSGP